MMGWRCMLPDCRREGGIDTNILIRGVTIGWGWICTIHVAFADLFALKYNRICNV